MNYDNVTVKEYIENKLKMLNGLGRTGCICIGVKCSDCPLSELNNKTNYDCGVLEFLYPEKAIEIVMNYEPKIDWSKVPVDTKVLVKDYEEEDWNKRYFAKYENGKIYTYPSGLSSFTFNEGDNNLSKNLINWRYVKLYKGASNEE